MLRKLFTSVCLLGAILAPALASAGDGPWKVRGRIIDVSPNESSDTIPVVGGEVAVDSATTIEVDVTYMFNESWGLEVIAARPSHDLSAADGTDLGTAKLLPPTFTAQYFFKTSGKAHPYVGLGLNYTTFSYDLSADLADTGATDVDFDSALGFAANGGVDVSLKGGWLLNFDVKYVSLSTDATIKGGALDGAKIGVDINPWILGVGVGYRF